MTLKQKRFISNFFGNGENVDFILEGLSSQYCENDYEGFKETFGVYPSEAKDILRKFLVTNKKNEHQNN